MICNDENIVFGEESHKAISFSNFSTFPMLVLSALMNCSAIALILVITKTLGSNYHPLPY